ncbi:MAG: hypothetical protein LBC31_10415 [Treponema sp.]|jgi:hypothetical protein|nr:hypothetical protein [Treponema sp.]
MIKRFFVLVLLAVTVWAGADAPLFTAVANTGFGSSDVTCIAWGGGKFVAGGAMGGDDAGMSLLAYSADGISWTMVTDLPFPFDFGQITAVAYDGTGNYLAVSYNGIGVESTVAYSTDAVTWIIHGIRNPQTGSVLYYSWTNTSDYLTPAAFPVPALSLPKTRS